MSDPLKVLLIEDSEDDALLVTRALQTGGFDVTCQRVETASEMEAALDNEDWDLVIADYSLPEFTGVNALRLFNARKLEIPFIVVSGIIGEVIAVAMMRAGAHDYIMKHDLARLAPAVRRELGDAKTRRERRSAQVALRESEERYRALFEQSKDAIYMTSLSGDFVDANPAALELFGYTREEMFEMKVSDLYLGPRRPEELLQSVSEDGFVANIEGQFLKKDGSVINCVLSLTARRNEEGEIIGTQGIARDVTHERKL